MWPECQGTLSHAPFVDFSVAAMKRRRTAVRAEISVYILYIVLALSHSSLELYILYTIHPIHPYILYTIHPYTLPLCSQLQA